MYLKDFTHKFGLDSKKLRKISPKASKGRLGLIAEPKKLLKISPKASKGEFGLTADPRKLRKISPKASKGQFGLIAGPKKLASSADSVAHKNLLTWMVFSVKI